jgi:hypothetical protein
LYNYRLAQLFDVSTRQIQRWLHWLHAHQLIHTYWYLGQYRRLVVNPYPTSHAWLASMALPRPQKHPSKSPYSHRLSPAEKEASRQRQIRSLFEV